MLKQFQQSVSATLWREWHRMLKRPIYWIASVGVMSFCYIFFLTFFHEGQPTAMPIGVIDLDQTSVSREIIRNIDATQQANVMMQASSFTEARKAMQAGKIYAFVLIQHHFTNDLMNNQRPTLTFYVNEGYFIAGSLLLKDISYMSALTSGAYQKKVLEAKGMSESRIRGIIQPIALDVHLIGNPWANYGIYLLNVLLPGELQLMILLLTIFSIGVELKERTARSWFKTANHSFSAALIGKLLPYTFIFTFIGIVGDILLYDFMKYPMQSSIGWMFLATFLLVIAYQAVGVFIIGLLPVLRDGIAMAAFYGLLAFTYAGFTFPIEYMPSNVQIFSELFPIRHYFRMYVNEALLGLDIRHSLVQIAAMLTFLLLPLLVFTRLKKAVIYLHYPIK